MNLRHIKRLLQEQNDVLCLTYRMVKLGFPHSLVGKESSCKAGDLGLIPGLGKSPVEGNGYPVQYSCLENSMDRGAWQATKGPLGLKPGLPAWHKRKKIHEF